MAPDAILAPGLAAHPYWWAVARLRLHALDIEGRTDVVVIDGVIAGLERPGGARLRPPAARRGAARRALRAGMQLRRRGDDDPLEAYVARQLTGRPWFMPAIIQAYRLHERLQEWP